MSNYSVLKQDINNNIYENQTQQITGTVLNAILNEMTASLGAGYQFAGVATLGMNPGDPDQRVFYLAGEGIYTNFGGLQVPAGKLGVLKWDNRWTLQTIDGLGGGGANLTGYVSVASTDDLPDEGVATLGYLCGTNLYLYVGEGGDTKEGKYQDCGSFRGPEGAYIQDIEQTETSHENGGRNTIKMTLSDGRSFNAYVHNGTTSSGLFPTVEALQAAYPNPVVGQYAFVGAGFPADIYVCTTAGTWTDSGEDYDGDNVDLTDYATKAEVNQLEAEVGSIYTKTGVEFDVTVSATSGATIPATVEYPVLLRPGGVYVSLEDEDSVLSDGLLPVYKFVNGVRTYFFDAKVGEVRYGTTADIIEGLSFYKSGGSVSNTGTLKIKIEQRGVFDGNIRDVKELAGKKVERVEVVGPTSTLKTDWQVGQKCFDTEWNLIKVCTTASPTAGFATTYPPSTESVYLCGGVLYVWDGVVLRSLEILEEIEVVGPTSTVKTDWQLGEKFFDTETKTIKVCKSASPSATFSFLHNPSTKSLYLCDGIVYSWDGTSLKSPDILLGNLEKAYNPTDKTLSLGTISFDGVHATQTKWLDVPIRFDENTFITLHTNRTDAVNNDFYVYAVYSNNTDDRVMLLPNVQPVGETVIQIPSNGWECLYGIMFYNPNMYNYSLTAYLELTAKSKSVKFFDEPEKRANYVPEYYFQNNYLEKKFSIINKYLRENILSGDAFYYVTDTHWEFNKKRSPAIIHELNKRLNIPKLFHGGDLYHNAPVIDEVEVDCINSYRAAMGGNSVYSCQGNHEYIGNEKYGDVFVEMSMHLNDVEFGGPNKQYYYLDNKAAKIRYIVLYVFGERVGGVYTHGYNDTTQLEWLQDVALNVESGWDIVILTHFVCSPSLATNEYEYETGFSNLANIVNGYDGNGRIVAVITGHTHRDFVLMESINVPIIITTCDHNFNFYWNGVYDFANLQTPRNSDTINEQAFDVVIYDMGRCLFHFVRIGSEADNKMNRLITNEQVACRSIYCTTKSVGDSIVLPTYLTSSVTWESSDTSVATVNEGTVSCVGAGSVRITATDSNGEKQSFYLKVV